MWETYFLEPVTPLPELQPNFANASGNITFFGFSHPASGSVNTADVEEIVTGGGAFASIIFDAFTSNDAALSDLAADISTEGQGETYEIAAGVQLEIVSSYDIGAQENFSFDFSADVSLDAKEIENPQSEYSFTQARTAFLVLDLTQGIQDPQIVDFFSLSAQLITSEQEGDLSLSSSHDVDIIFADQDQEVDGDNGIDFVEGDAFGAYNRTFEAATQLTVVKINHTQVDLLGDVLNGNLGSDVLYGTLLDDTLRGTQHDDKIYGSLGDDQLIGKGGDDILEGGDGDDRLVGEMGDDAVNGGSGNDSVRGNAGDDILYGGSGNDQLIGDRGDDLLRGGLGRDRLFGGSGIDTFVLEAGGGTDRIIDFKLGVDFIGLANGLSFADLTFERRSILLGDERLAILNGALDVRTLTADDFTAV